MNNKKTMSAHENLLEKLMQDCGCSYLSDLHSTTVRADLIACLDHIEADAYPVRQWTEAVSYIAGVRSEKESATELKSVLIHELTK